MTSVTLVRQIKARPSTVFELLSTEEGLTSWWGPEDRPVLSAQADVRVGGRFRVRFTTADGEAHECAGEFLEIQPTERIAMTWEWTEGGEPEERGNVSHVAMNLRPIEIGTELTLVLSGLRNAIAEASHGWGWERALDKFEARMNVADDAAAQG